MTDRTALDVVAPVIRTAVHHGAESWRDVAAAVLTALGIDPDAPLDLLFAHARAEGARAEQERLLAGLAEEPYWMADEHRDALIFERHPYADQEDG